MIEHIMRSNGDGRKNDGKEEDDEEGEKIYHHADKRDCKGEGPMATTAVCRICSRAVKVRESDSASADKLETCFWA